MIRLDDVRVEGSDYDISLVKLTGIRIVDITGYLSNEFGEPVFKVKEIVFEGGATVYVEGEHDIAYLSMYGKDTPPNLTDETIADLYRQENGNE